MSTAESRLAEVTAERDRLLRQRNDRDYMLHAVVPMLGPKARRVWDGWQAQGVTRLHFDWGPEGEKTTGEERAEVHLQIEEAVKTAVPADELD